ncbi:MAG: Co2+/Mg2+ efflux protein ApaG [Rhizobiaceae bacterium]|nr:Co2+/Mg2+ efflux protein ApaG [Rhizobiaceae bacterium]
MYKAITRDIEVMAEPIFLEDRSNPDDGEFFWAYRITIANNSQRWVKLLSRYWRITDGLGRVHEVRGDGVVGDQPELEPGDSYQYTSGCPLTTASGFMAGTYTMSSADGETFEIDIPAFSLDVPGQAHSVN